MYNNINNNKIIYNINRNRNNNYNNNVNSNINNNNHKINNNINNNINKNNSKNKINTQGINVDEYLINKRPSYNINNNIYSFNNLNQLEFNRRTSYNIANNNNNNLAYLIQREMKKRPSYQNNTNAPNALNNFNVNDNSMPIVGKYTQIKSFNNNISERNNIVNIKRNYQDNQLNMNNFVNQNNSLRENQLLKNNLINKINPQNYKLDSQSYHKLHNKSPVNTPELFSLSLKNNKIMKNRQFYMTENNNNQKNRNISSEVNKNQNIIKNNLYQNNNYYAKFQNQLNNIDLFPSDNNKELNN